MWSVKCMTVSVIKVCDILLTYDMKTPADQVEETKYNVVIYVLKFSTRQNTMKLYFPKNTGYFSILLNNKNKITKIWRRKTKMGETLEKN